MQPNTNIIWPECGQMKRMLETQLRSLLQSSLGKNLWNCYAGPPNISWHLNWTGAQNPAGRIAEEKVVWVIVAAIVDCWPKAHTKWRFLAVSMLNRNQQNVLCEFVTMGEHGLTALKQQSKPGTAPGLSTPKRKRTIFVARKVGAAVYWLLFDYMNNCRNIAG